MTNYIMIVNILSILFLILVLVSCHKINKYMRIQINDSPTENIKNSFNSAFNLIDEAVQKNENILIHCHVGVSRSPTIVASYLMKKYNISSSHALRIIKKKREYIQPNSGFLRQLKEYEIILDE